MTHNSTAVRSSYLGFPILVGERNLIVLDPSGRRLLEGRYELSTARSFIRGYRRAERESTEPAALLLAECAAGSDNEGA